MARVLVIDPKDDLLRLLPFLPDISEAIIACGEAGTDGRFDIDAAALGAIAIRETRACWARGYYPQGDPDGCGDDPDGELGPRAAFGRGMFQIDTRGPYGKYIPPKGTPWPVFDQAKVAIRALQDGRVELRAFREHPRYEQAIFCAYNAGSPRVARALREGRDPDLVTTDGADPDKVGDYGSDVIRIRESLYQRYPQRFTRPERCVV